MMATVFNALHGVNEYGEEITYRMDGRISVDGYPDVTVQNMFAAVDGGQPGCYAGCASLWANASAGFTTIRTACPRFAACNLISISSANAAGPAWKAARTDITEARPGDDITIEALLRPYRGDSIVEHDSHSHSDFDFQGNAAHSGQRRRNSRSSAPGFLRSWDTSWTWLRPSPF